MAKFQHREWWLANTQQSHNKVYIMELRQISPVRFGIHIRYGRIGQSLRSYDHTYTGMLNEVTNLIEKLARQKRQKGYQYLRSLPKPDMLYWTYQSSDDPNPQASDLARNNDPLHFSTTGEVTHSRQRRKPVSVKPHDDATDSDLNNPFMPTDTDTDHQPEPPPKPVTKKDLFNLAEEYDK